MNLLLRQISVTLLLKVMYTESIFEMRERCGDMSEKDEEKERIDAAIREMKKAIPDNPPWLMLDKIPDKLKSESSLPNEYFKELSTEERERIISELENEARKNERTKRDLIWEGVISTICIDGIVDIRRIERHILFHKLSQTGFPWGDSPKFDIVEEYNEESRERASIFCLVRPSRILPEHIPILSKPVSLAKISPMRESVASLPSSVLEATYTPSSGFFMTKDGVFSKVKSKYKSLEKVPSETQIGRTLKAMEEMEWLEYFEDNTKVNKYAPTEKSNRYLEISDDACREIIEERVLPSEVVDNRDMVKAVAMVEHSTKMEDVPYVASLIPEYKREMTEKAKDKLLSEENGEEIIEKYKTEEEKGIEELAEEVVRDRINREAMHLFGPYSVR
jgi:hypothetical protein